MDALSTAVQATHQTLATALERATDMTPTPGQPRKGYERIDTFLQAAARHLNGVDAVLLPPARRHGGDGARLVHDYLVAARRLEVQLATVKALEYGSAQQSYRSWPSVWGDVQDALVDYRKLEARLVDRLEHELGPEELDRLADALAYTEAHAPTRVHPYLPHQGLPGRLARTVVRRVDAFWDNAEGHVVPHPPEPPKRSPGLLGQYVLGAPTFGEDPDPEASGGDGDPERGGDPGPSSR